MTPVDLLTASMAVEPFLTHLHIDLRNHSVRSNRLSHAASSNIYFDRLKLLEEELSCHDLEILNDLTMHLSHLCVTN